MTSLVGGMLELGGGTVEGLLCDPTPLIFIHMVVVVSGLGGPHLVDLIMPVVLNL